MAKKQSQSLLELARQASQTQGLPLFNHIPESMRADCVEIAKQIVSGQMLLSGRKFAALLREQGVAVSESYLINQINRLRVMRQSEAE